MLVNPDAVVAQMESGIVFGLTAALYGEITIDNGRVRQSNFHGYPMLRMTEMPVIDVHTLPSTEAPGGVGEPSVPPIAPAVTNAMFAATGKRIRSLPISRHALGRPERWRLCVGRKEGEPHPVVPCDLYHARLTRLIADGQDIGVAR